MAARLHQLAETKPTAAASRQALQATYNPATGPCKRARTWQPGLEQAGGARRAATSLGAVTCVPSTGMWRTCHRDMLAGLPTAPLRAWLATIHPPLHVASHVPAAT